MTSRAVGRVLTWGVLGAAKIARERVVPAVRQSPLHRFSAIASRDFATARLAAQLLGIERAYAGYDALLRDIAVDAVYVPLPNHMHVEWTLRSIEAGKHVLCEKPLAFRAADVRRIADAARAAGVIAMEGFMVLAHPRWRAVQNLIRSGIIGDLGTIHVTFSNPNFDPRNIRNQRETGGGALLDKGCYCLALARFLFGEEPTAVLASRDIDPAFGIDRATAGVLRFSRGLATFHCSSQDAPHQHLTVIGTGGRIEVPVPMTPSDDTPTRIEIHAIREGSHPDVQELIFDPCNQYRLMFDGFAQAVFHGDDLPVPLSFSEGNAGVLEQILRAEAAQAGPG
jgi:predicted dehydrogenase